MANKIYDSDIKNRLKNIKSSMNSGGYSIDSGKFIPESIDFKSLEHLGKTLHEDINKAFNSIGAATEIYDNYPWEVIILNDPMASNRELVMLDQVNSDYSNRLGCRDCSSTCVISCGGLCKTDCSGTCLNGCTSDCSSGCASACSTCGACTGCTGCNGCSGDDLCPMGCSWIGSQGNCWNCWGCTGCRGCGGCNGCSGNCEGECKGSCKSDCGSSCSTSCSTTCMNDCNTTCYQSCSTMCTSTCSSACDGTCDNSARLGTLAATATPIEIKDGKGVFNFSGYIK